MEDLMDEWVGCGLGGLGMGCLCNPNPELMVVRLVTAGSDSLEVLSEI